MATSVNTSRPALVQERKAAERQFFGKSAAVGVLAAGLVIASVLAAPIAAIVALAAAAFIGLAFAIQSAMVALKANAAVKAQEKQAAQLTQGRRV